MINISSKNIWRVAYPILISLAMEQLLGMTDTAFLGRVGEIELGASALAGVFYTVVFMLGMGFSIGVQIIIGKRNGSGNYADVGKAFWQGTYFLIALALILCLVFELFTPVLMDIMVSSDNIRAASCDYLRYRIPSLLFAFGTAMYRAFYVGTTQTKTLTFNSLVMVVANIFFNWVLIFGKLGLPAMGIKGAALGSTLAEAVTLLVFIARTPKVCDRSKYGLDKVQKIDFKELKSILGVSLWTMIQNFVSIFTWFIFFLFIEHTGERALAISNIIRNTSGLVWMVLMAFASTSSTLVSNLIGEGRYESVRPLILRVCKITYTCLIPLLLLFVLFPKLVLGIYTDINDLIINSIPSLWVLAASYLLTIPATILFQSVCGTGKTKVAFLLELSALLVYTIFCYIIIELMHSDVALCWSSEAVYAAVMLLSSALYLRSQKWCEQTEK
ncbi:MAG: MATE family efflux transporter [Candidatus Cryptobacteroides sp.]